MNDTNWEALCLFLILVLGLLLCSFLGGNCNYESFTDAASSSTAATSSTYSDTSNNNMGPSNFNSNTSNVNGPNNNYGQNQGQYNGSNQGPYNNNQSAGNNLSNNNSSQYDNYNHFSGSSSQLTPGTTFTETSGGTVTVQTGGDGSQSLQVSSKSGEPPITFTSVEPRDTSTKEGLTTYSGNSGTLKTFYGPGGQTATVITTGDGQPSVRISSNNGSIIYTLSGTDPNSAIYNSNISSTNLYGSTGKTTSPAIYGTGTEDIAASMNSNASSGNTAINTKGGYNSSLPRGIPASQILPGQEDLYILKSQIVPPVCPICPNLVAAAGTAFGSDGLAFDSSKCPACPPCGRCPEQPFECKKVPNYNAASSSSYLPVPVLNDFSTFGM